MTYSQHKGAIHLDKPMKDAHAPLEFCEPRPWLAFAFPALALVCWALAIRHLSSDWTLNEQYHYGWLVPLLALYLVKVRFERCPAQGPRPSAAFAWSALLLFAFLSALSMPLREANTDWRLMGWWLTGLAAGVTLLGFWQAGGRRWMTYFVFPVLFFFIAVPVMRPVEDAAMQWLMRHNARLSVEVLHWLGISGEAMGNLISLPGCTLGVNEACSGVRSLQGTLMLTLFLGEILSLTWPRRAALLLAGTGWALITNVARTVALAQIAARSGLAAVDRWHDSAGYTVLAFCAAAVTFTAWLLRPEIERTPNLETEIAIARRLRQIAIPSAIGLVILLAGYCFTEGWFRMQERSVATLVGWSFRLPIDRPKFRETEIASRIRAELRFDEGRAGVWQDEAGRRWQALYFQWLPGKNSAQMVAVHDPRVCLAATGLREVASLPPVVFDRGGVTLAFDAYHFRDGLQDVFIFNCLAEDVRRAGGESRIRAENTISSRIAAALAGRRHLGQRRLETAVWGEPNADAAEASFRSLLESQLDVNLVIANK